MKYSIITVLAAGLFSAAPAFSAVTIDFEGPDSFASIGEYYSGLGVSFGLDAFDFKNDDLGPYFSNAPSPIGAMAPVGTSATMNVAGGFTGAVDFQYSSNEAVTIGLWSGLDGTGTPLGTFTLTNNAQSDNCSDSPFCHWDVASFAIPGNLVAKSITFGDAIDTSDPTKIAYFDNVTINAVPEPSSWALMALGIVGMGAILRSGRRGRREQAAS